MNLRKDHYRFRRSRFPCGCGLVVYPQPAAGVSPVASDSLLNSLTTPRGRGLPGGSVDLRGGPRRRRLALRHRLPLCLPLSLERGAPGSGGCCARQRPTRMPLCLGLVHPPHGALARHSEPHKPSVADLPTPVGWDRRAMSGYPTRLPPSERCAGGSMSPALALAPMSVGAVARRSARAFAFLSRNPCLKLNCGPFCSETPSWGGGWRQTKTKKKL